MDTHVTMHLELLKALTKRIVTTNKYDKIINTYAELETDQQCIQFTLYVMLHYNIIPNTTGMPKNAIESEKLREQGNKLYIKEASNNNICIDALKLYTKSIAFAPYPSEQLALAYANRSAVLFQLGLHSECIQDINRALALKHYPDHLRPKIYVRKAECLIILGDCSAADSILKEAQHWLDKIFQDDKSREKIQKKLDILHDKTKQSTNNSIYTKVKKAKNKSLLPTIVSYNSEAPCASDAVAIKYNTQYGRHVIATRDIRLGEVIAVEKPYVLLLMKENIQTHCSNCLNVCWANIPCNYCTYTMYCSEKCKDDEWKRCHNIECAVFPILLEYGFHHNFFVSIRLAILAIKEAGNIKKLKTLLKKVDERNDPRTKGFSQDGKLHSDKYISVYSLATNSDKRIASDYYKISFYASFILYFLATRTVIFGANKLSEDLNILVKNDDVTFFGGLILKNLQIVSNNSHSFDEFRSVESVTYRGTAVMPFMSLINHSCNPNIFRQSRATHVVLYAVQPIQKGEQLLDSYGPHYAVMLRETRQEFLKNYFFICDCVPCQNNWPLYNELQSFETLMEETKEKVKIKTMLEKFSFYYFLVKKGNMREKDKPLILEELLKVLQTLHDYATMPCGEITDLTNLLQQIYNLNANRFDIPQIREYEK